MDVLSNLRHYNTRVEFIVDTNVLISGVGHWLVRYLGDICDLVRTVVTDLEVQGFGDRKKWVPTSFSELSSRTCFLAASRFLEYLREQHPVWRRLDIEEETALFVASASTGQKEAGSDTLMLRSVRRCIQEQVPGLTRLFVTSDQNAARNALHDLPSGSIVAAYVPPLSAEGAYLTPVHWWPSKSGEGACYLSGLSSFLYEATSFCDTVKIAKGDGSFLQVRSTERTQFPSDWQEPSLIVEEVAPPNNAFVADLKPDAAPESVQSKPVVVVQDTHEPASAGSAAEEEKVKKASADSALKIGISVPMPEGGPAAWPLTPDELREPVFCTARATGRNVVEAAFAVASAARESRRVSKRALPGAPGPVRELRTLLRAVDILAEDDRPGPEGIELPEIFKNDALDRLSHVFTKASAYGTLISSLKSQKIASLAALPLPARSATALSGLARFLGQAVMVDEVLVYGGGFVSRERFINWFLHTIDSLEKGPLGDVLLADVAKRALYEMSLSPVRFEKALRSAIAKSPIAELEFSAGGTPENVLAEQVAVLSEGGWRQRNVSADGVLGYRSIRRRA